MANIVSVQPFSITIGSGSTTNTATITSVSTANAVIFYGGQSNTSTASTGAQVADMALTNSTTVTATRSGTAATTTIVGTVVEFDSSVVNSVQYGTVSLSATSSGTATLGTSVGANAFVIPLGAVSASLPATWSTSLTNSTTITVAISSGTATGTFAFVVVDLTSTIIASVQQIEIAGTSLNSTTTTTTISSVAAADSFVINNGLDAATGGSILDFSSYAYLAGATTLEFVRGTAANHTANLRATVVELQSAALTANGVQAGTITLAAGSGTAPITSVGSLAAAQTAGWTANSAGVGWENYVNQVVLTNATTVTASSGYATATDVVGWQVIDWAAGGGGGTIVNLSGLSATSALGAITAAVSFADAPLSASSSLATLGAGAGEGIGGISASTTLGAVMAGASRALTGLTETSAVGSLTPGAVAGLPALSETTALGSISVSTSGTTSVALSGIGERSALAPLGAGAGHGMGGVTATATIGTLATGAGSVAPSLTAHASLAALVEGAMAVLGALGGATSLASLIVTTQSGTTIALSGLSAVSELGIEGELVLVGMSGLSGTMALGVLTVTGGSRRLPGQPALVRSVTAQPFARSASAPQQDRNRTAGAYGRSGMARPPKP